MHTSFLACRLHENRQRARFGLWDIICPRPAIDIKQVPIHFPRKNKFSPCPLGHQWGLQSELRGISEHCWWEKCLHSWAFTLSTCYVWKQQPRNRLPGSGAAGLGPALISVVSGAGEGAMPGSSRSGAAATWVKSSQ